MRKLSCLVLVIALWCFKPLNVEAQDLIVKHNGDSIVAKIEKVDKVFINYHFTDENSRRYDQVKLIDVEYFQYKYLNEGSVRIKGKTRDDQSNQGLPSFRLAASIGPAYQLGRVDADGNQLVEDYLNGLKWGLSYNFDLHFYIEEEFGIGAKFARFQANNRLDNVALIDSAGNVIGVGTISDNISILFIGPSGTYRKRDPISGNAFIVNAFIGYMYYFNEGLLIFPFSMEGSTVGIGFDAGYDIKIENGLFLGIQLSVYTGSLSSLDITDQNGSRTLNFEDPAEYIGLQRVELTIGLRFGK